MSRPSVADALADCLARIEAGESTAAVVADHVEHGPELAALVAAAAAVRAHRPVPPPAFRAALQHRLATDGLPQDRWRTGARRWALRAVGVAAAVVFAFSGLAVASADSRPGDLLYPVRRGVTAVHDVAERVAPPIGRAIDYLTIHELDDDPAAAAATPTLALAPGSRLIERRRSGVGGRLDDAGDAAAAPEATAAGRARPRPGVVEVDGAERPSAPAEDARPAPAEPPRAPVATAAAPSPTPRRSPTAPPTASPLPPSATAAPVALAAHAPGGIAGWVSGQDGVGLPGALVSVYPVDPDGNVRFSKWRGVRTVDDGTYFIANLPAGTYKLAVGELAPWVWRVWYRDTVHVKRAEPITVVAGQLTADIDVQLRRSRWSFDWGGDPPRPPDVGRRPRH